MRYAWRVLAWLALVIVPACVLATVAGGAGALGGFGLGVVAVLYVWLWLPRAAHAAFEATSYDAAARRYRVLEVMAPTAARERAALLSRAGCAIAARQLPLAERLLAALDGAVLPNADRAVWLNNRACLQLASGSDAHAALALADEAGALRPDVPALQHTRALALLAVGRIDDAIAALDHMRGGSELSPRLEEDRCRELARAWAAKGETAYAEDYRLRAEGFAK
jgi:predicted Zn-dependent protease